MKGKRKMKLLLDTKEIVEKSVNGKVQIEVSFIYEVKARLRSDEPLTEDDRIGFSNGMEVMFNDNFREQGVSLASDYTEYLHLDVIVQEPESGVSK
jgi:hypothetical protein